MRRTTVLILATAVVLAGAVPATGLVATGGAGPDGAPAAAETTTNGTANGTTLTVLTYNDVQTAAAEDGKLPRLVHLVEERRAAHDNPVVVAGAGDEVGPHALSPVSRWRAPIAVLNEMNPDAEVVGNHEFDYTPSNADGFPVVSNFTAASEFPWLATNVVNESTGEAFDGTKKYEIVERGGVRVGFVGLLGQGAAYGSTNINFSARGVEVRDATAVGPETAQMLKEEKNVDVVVALAHTGVPTAKQIARNDSGAIDLIAVGHDEIKYPPQETSGTVITEGVARAEYLSEVNLTVENGEVTAWNGRLVNVTEDVPKNETASRIIDEHRSEAKLDTVVGRTETPLNATSAANYHRETGYGNLITDAMRAETGANVAITNAGGIRSDSVYGPGNVTGGDVFNTLPFENTLVTVRLTGAELKRVLASQIVTQESEVGAQYGAEVSQQVSGVRFEWVPHENATKVRDVSINRAGPDGEPRWVPLRENETYEVTVNSYMAAGGDGYPLEDAPRVSETDKLLATTVVEYLERRGTVAPRVEGRMQRVDADVGDATVRVDCRGKQVLRFDAPAGFERPVPDSFVLAPQEPGTDPIPVEVLSVANGTVTVRFDEAPVYAYADGSDTAELDLYGEYESAENRTFWDASRLNADVTVLVGDESRPERAAAATPAESAAGAGASNASVSG